MRESESTKNSVVKGAIVVSCAGLIAKILGALYRIPLTNILQADGLGIYQTVFPIYALLLTLSSSGIPSAVAKLISSGEPADKVLARSLSVFLPMGLLGTTALCLLSVPLSSFQGIPEARYAYIALSPAVTFVSAIACARGYFQGGGDMFPTAASQVVEQSIKLTIGLFLCYLFKADYALAGAAACFGVTVSEIIATAYLFSGLKRNKLFRAQNRNDGISDNFVCRNASDCEGFRQFYDYKYNRRIFFKSRRFIRSVYGQRRIGYRRTGRFMLRSGNFRFTANLFGCIKKRLQIRKIENSRSDSRYYIPRIFILGDNRDFIPFNNADIIRRFYDRRRNNRKQTSVLFGNQRVSFISRTNVVGSSYRT